MVSEEPCQACYRPIRREPSALYCWTCYRAVEPLRRAASKAVWEAIRDGLLTDPSRLRCVDCGEAAREYDHRDYLLPLDVEPVCRRCNWARGPAIQFRNGWAVASARLRPDLFGKGT